MSRFISVVLPQPVGPTIATRIPLFTSSENRGSAPCRACRKTNIAEADIAGAFSLFIALSRVRRSGGIDFRRGVDKLKQPRRTGKRALQFRNNSGNFVERLCVLVGIA